MLLIEQNVINPSEERISALKSGEVSAFSFMVDLIRNLEITPAQLALDPYSASCVITDVNTGDVKALVSYPSYDNNRLANGIDSEYYARVSSGEDRSKTDVELRHADEDGARFHLQNGVRRCGSDGKFLHSDHGSELHGNFHPICGLSTPLLEDQRTRESEYHRSHHKLLQSVFL